MTMGTEPIQIRRLIANLMSASTPIEAYLQQGKPLTPLDLDSLSLTISGLQTLLDVWRRKNKVPPAQMKSRT